MNGKSFLQAMSHKVVGIMNSAIARFHDVKENLTKIPCGKWEMVDRIPFVSDPTLSFEEQSHFRSLNAWYPIIEGPKFITRWVFDEELNISKKNTIKQIWRPALPFAPKPEHVEDPQIMQRILVSHCYAVGIVFTPQSPIVLETKTVKGKMF